MSTELASALIWVFWISSGLILYTYFCYPLLLTAVARWRKDRRPAAGGDWRPRVSLCFAAYNEEAVIAGKMRNCAALDYPADRLEILVGCDGCSDRTAELARADGPPNARIFDYKERSGKLRVLNRLFEEARGEIIVLTDASTLLQEDAVRCLVRHFTDPDVGCACGEMRLSARGGRPRTESLHWRYEVFLKVLESRLNALVGASGCVYAIRRSHFSPLPPNAINEDFLIPMFIRAGGHRVVYDRDAVGVEEEAPMQQNFSRHVRIGAGNWHALRLTARLLSPTAGWIALSYWSHKVFRWLIPFLIPVSVLSALLLALDGRPFYAVCTALAAALVLLALVGHRIETGPDHGHGRALFSVPYYFFSMNLALLFGFARFLTGRQTATWDRGGHAKDRL